MSDEFGSAVMGSRVRTSNRTSGSRADDAEGSEYTHRGYDRNTGQSWAEQRRTGAGARATYGEMAGYVSGSGSEANYNRRERQSYKSRFGAEQHGHHAGAQQDEFEENNYAGAEATPDVAAVVPVLTAQELANFDIANEKGLRHDLVVQFHGAPNQFERKRAPVSADVDVESGATRAASEWEARAEQMSSFDPSLCHFEGTALAKQMRAPARMMLLTDKNARAIADVVAAQRCVVPLAVTVRTGHNPFDYPIGIKASHDELNQATTLSGERFMVVLPPGTHDANKRIDLRSGINAPSVCASAAVATEDIRSQYKASGPDAPGFMMVKEGSTLHDAIETFSAGRKFKHPVDFSKLPTSKSAGGNYFDCVPEEAVYYALDQLRKIKGSNHGKLSVDNVSFTVHPCNFEGRWDGPHLSGAGYDKMHNETLYTDFMHRPQSVMVNLELEYL